jgi:hypothetical protein
VTSASAREAPPGPPREIVPEHEIGTSVGGSRPVDRATLTAVRGLDHDAEGGGGRNPTPRRTVGWRRDLVLLWLKPIPSRSPGSFERIVSIVRIEHDLSVGGAYEAILWAKTPGVAEAALPDGNLNLSHFRAIAGISMCAMIVSPCRVNLTVPVPAEVGGRGAAPRLDQYTVHSGCSMSTARIWSAPTADGGPPDWAAASWLDNKRTMVRAVQRDRTEARMGSSQAVARLIHASLISFPCL